VEPESWNSVIEQPQHGRTALLSCSVSIMLQTASRLPVLSGFLFLVFPFYRYLSHHFLCLTSCDVFSFIAVLLLSPDAVHCYHPVIHVD
jgi:hypothetical protein